MTSNNLNPFKSAITEGISLITAVKNRKGTLEQALKTWLTHDEIDEIIIVDWDSDESLISMVNDFQDSRVLLVVAENQKRWIQTKAFNLGARFSTSDKIMKIDGDIKINHGFFDHHPLTKGVFYTGNWALGRDSNETHLNGTAYIYRNDFFNVNGYNELLKLYGYDDTDLYMRLEKTGLVKLDFNNDYLYHIEHESRVAAVELSDYVDKLTDSQKADISILMNRYLLTQSFSWNTTNQMIKMEVNQMAPNILVCKQLTQEEPFIPDDVLQKSLKIAMQERLQLSGQEFSNKLFETGDRNEMIDLYYIFQNRNGNQAYENIYSLIYKYDHLVSGEIMMKDNYIKTLNEKLQMQEEMITELVQRVDSIYKSYSWRFGHGVFSLFSRINPISLFYKKNKPG